MSETNNKQLAKVRALLSKAEDPAASPDEAQAYFAKAADLMAKYGIEKAMLAEADPESDEITYREFVIKGKYVADRADLLSHITTALGGRYVYWNLQDHAGKRYRRAKVYAHESTLDRIEMLYSSLALQALNGMKYGRPLLGESTTSYRKSWLAGFRVAVFRRLVQAEHTAATESTETARGRSAELVLVDRKKQVEIFFEREHPKLRKVGPRRLNGSGWRDGKAAGNRADIGNKRVDGRRVKALAS